MKINQKGFTLVETLLVVLVLAVIGFGGYYVWQNQNENNDAKANSTEATVTKTESKKNNTDPYQGWKSYTLPYEKLSFKYPSDWAISNENAKGRDVVRIKSSDNFTVIIQVGVQAGGDLTYVGNWPTQFDNSTAYLSFISGGTRMSPNTNVTGSAILTIKPGDPTTIPANKNVKGCAGCDGVNGPEDSNLSIMMSYEPRKEMSVEAAKSDTGYSNGKLIIESMHY